MQKESDALRCYRGFAEQAWNESDKRIKYVRWHYAKEFLSSAFKQYISTQGTVSPNIFEFSISWRISWRIPRNNELSRRNGLNILWSSGQDYWVYRKYDCWRDCLWSLSWDQTFFISGRYLRTGIKRMHWTISIRTFLSGWNQDLRTYLLTSWKEPNSYPVSFQKEDWRWREVCRYKARVVFMQREGINFCETVTGSAKFPWIRCLIVITAYYGLKLEQCNQCNAASSEL